MGACACCPLRFLAPSYSHRTGSPGRRRLRQKYLLELGIGGCQYYVQFLTLAADRGQRAVGGDWEITSIAGQLLAASDTLVDQDFNFHRRFSARPVFVSFVSCWAPYSHGSWRRYVVTWHPPCCIRER